MLRTIIGERIGAIRRRSGLSQQALADKMDGFNRANIAAYEAGHNQPPLAFLTQFVVICNSSYQEILEGKKTAQEDQVTAWQENRMPYGQPKDIFVLIKGLQISEHERAQLMAEVAKLYRQLSEQKDKVIAMNDRVVEILQKRP